MTATVAFCSSIYTAAIDNIKDDFHCSDTVGTLGVTTFLLGFGSGSLLFAPLSELWYASHSFHLKEHGLTRAGAASQSTD